MPERQHWIPKTIVGIVGWSLGTSWGYRLYDNPKYRRFFPYIGRIPPSVVAGLGISTFSGVAAVALYSKFGPTHWEEEFDDLDIEIILDEEERLGKRLPRFMKTPYTR
eukprot:TRINITY_DN1579_c0_g1_i1.p1 TRINITY_DN1579_c0_g1~~TRINITY_DN1579_c0_g1_i1.p1  ORF type:complete len:108 (+),score=6.57 TRINITY_DN1579_c0_g1_i1:245-568(+)